MRLGFPSPTRLINRVAYYLHHRLESVAGTIRPPGVADFSLELADTYRLEAHLALTLTRLGTLRASPALLRHLADSLDILSYSAVLARSRPATGPGTLRVVDQPAEPGDCGTRLAAVDDYYNRPRDCAPVWHYPYPMHPWVYALGWHRRVARLRDDPRRIRLFFAGVVNSGYAERFDFPILPRPAIIECVVDTFRTESCVVTNRVEARQIRRTDRPIVLIIFRGDVTPMASNHFVERADYLRLLARSHFALCPPGVFMPHSHNLIESMAVGTVPVLNYPEYCRPQLVDGVTCLAFETTADLVGAVRRTLALSPPAIDPIARAVADQYDRLLSPEGAARALTEARNDRGPARRWALNREFATARAWSASRELAP